MEYTYSASDIESILKDSYVLIQYIHELHELQHKLLYQQEELMEQNLKLMELSANNNNDICNNIRIFLILTIIYHIHT